MLRQVLVSRNLATASRSSGLKSVKAVVKFWLLVFFHFSNFNFLWLGEDSLVFRLDLQFIFFLSWPRKWIICSWPKIRFFIQDRYCTRIFELSDPWSDLLDWFSRKNWGFWVLCNPFLRVALDDLPWFHLNPNSDLKVRENQKTREIVAKEWKFISLTKKSLGISSRRTENNFQARANYVCEIGSCSPRIFQFFGQFLDQLWSQLYG